MKNNRLGILLIVSSLLVIALVVGLLLQRQQAVHAAQIRVQGVGVTRSLTALPLDLLAPANRQASVLQSLFVSFDNPDFGYAAVVAVDGTILAQVTRPGILVPVTPLPTGTASLFGERMLPAHGEDGRVREFYGPVIDAGSLKAFVRVGYFESGQILPSSDLPFFALLSLAMFLLVPFAYFMIKREMAPLSALSSQLQSIAQHQSTPVSLPDTAPAQFDVRGLAIKLQTYLETATTRIHDLERDGVRAEATSRLLEYGSNKMNAVLQCLPDGLMLLDPSGEVTFANSKIEPLLGVDIGDVLSQPVDQWCNDPDLRGLFTRYRGGSTDTGRQVSIEFSPAKVSDKRLRATAQPLVGGLGTMAFGTLIVLRDATREHLGQQAGNDFVANVSHELKSPLNVIAMYSEMLQSASADEPELRVEAINIIQDQVERMNALVGNLLSVSKLETGSLSLQRQRVKLDDLLQDCFDHAMPRAQNKKIKMELRVPRELAAVSIDKDLFSIALNNLLNNAVKYSDPGAHVSLVADENDDEIVITVRDTGIGITAEDQSHVFEKFYRATSGAVTTRSGHGLGLYLCGQIVELHHGRITLESTIGAGSAFAVHLKKVSLLVQDANVL